MIAIQRPLGMGAFQFTVLSTLRAAQLMRGCRPRVEGTHKPVITAQCEVSEGKITQWFEAERVAIDPAVTRGA